VALISRELHWTRAEVLGLPMAEFKKHLEMLTKPKQ
jgi:hypothetical protein